MKQDEVVKWLKADLADVERKRKWLIGAINYLNSQESSRIASIGSTEQALGSEQLPPDTKSNLYQHYFKDFKNPVIVEKEDLPKDFFCKCKGLEPRSWDVKDGKCINCSKVVKDTKETPKRKRIVREGLSAKVFGDILDIKEPFYKCGHGRTMVIMDCNPLSISAWYEWKDSVGWEGDKTQCWECWCDKESK